MRPLRSLAARAPSTKTPPASSRARNQRTQNFDLRFADAVRALNIEITPPIVLALSGGGDSIALMTLLSHWALDDRRSRTKHSLHALIVDHGLRSGSAGEAKNTAALARSAGWNAHILKWSGGKPTSNIEDAARKARYALMGKWCRLHKARCLFVGHTRNDVAETFLLRLGRGSGVDGLSAMRAVAPYPFEGFGELSVLRPLLDFGREELRAYLQKECIGWREDPMNKDPRFARTRIRELMPALEAAGVSQRRIYDAACHLARAREALEDDMDTFLRTHTTINISGNALVDRDALHAAPREIGLRALSKLISEVSGTQYRPRFERLLALYSGLCNTTKFRARTLQGCRIGPAPKRLQSFGVGTIEIKREKARKGP